MKASDILKVAGAVLPGGGIVGAAAELFKGKDAHELVNVVLHHATPSLAQPAISAAIHRMENAAARLELAKHLLDASEALTAGRQDEAATHLAQIVGLIKVF